MVLVSNQKGELDVEPLHHFLTPLVWRGAELDLPVGQHSLDEEVQTDQELDYFLVIVLEIESLGELIHF